MPQVSREGFEIIPRMKFYSVKLDLFIYGLDIPNASERERARRVDALREWIRFCSSYSGTIVFQK